MRANPIVHNFINHLKAITQNSNDNQYPSFKMLKLKKLIFLLQKKKKKKKRKKERGAATPEVTGVVGHLPPTRGIGSHPLSSFF